jgi:prepilin-type N-terminal cleavage/methylation domain-containing protein
MYRIKSRVPSFSLIEMLVVMVISSMMVGVIYFVYYTVNSYQVSLTRKYSEVENVNSLYSLLTNDFDRSEYIEATTVNELTCHVQYSGTKVSYSFFSNYILRKQESRVDSLACPSNSVAFLFQQKNTESGLIDELKIETLFFGGMTKLVFFKQYDAAILIGKIQQGHR